MQDYPLRVITNVVRRYDVDGVRCDDYFYLNPGKKTRAAKPAPPSVRLSIGKTSWRAGRGGKVFRRVVYTKDENGRRAQISSAGQTGFRLAAKVKNRRYCG